MTRKQDSARRVDWKAALAADKDFLRPMIQAMVQQVLEGEMDDALGRPKESGPASEWDTGRGTTAGA